MRIWCGIDWSERHHDVALVDDEGALVAKRRIPESAAGFRQLLELLAEHGGRSDAPILVAIETAKGLLPVALQAAGYRLFPINPLAVSRYRDRYAVSRAKSDPGDALVLSLSSGLCKWIGSGVNVLGLSSSPVDRLPPLVGVHIVRPRCAAGAACGRLRRGGKGSAGVEEGRGVVSQGGVPAARGRPARARRGPASSRARRRLRPAGRGPCAARAGRLSPSPGLGRVCPRCRGWPATAA